MAPVHLRKQRIVGAAFRAIVVVLFMLRRALSQGVDRSLCCGANPVTNRDLPRGPPPAGGLPRPGPSGCCIGARRRAELPPGPVRCCVEPARRDSLHLGAGASQDFGNRALPALLGVGKRCHALRVGELEVRAVRHEGAHDRGVRRAAVAQRAGRAP